jgi:N-acetylneuraminic acid mutarotase
MIIHSNPLRQMTVAALLFLGIASCQKEVPITPAAPATNPKSTTSLVVGPAPAIIWWSNGANLPFVDSEPGDVPSGITYPMGFAINGKGYVCGGVLWDSHGSAMSVHNLWEFDPSTQAWTEKAPCPVVPIEGASFVIGNSAYVLNQGATYQYNQLTNTWTQKASLPADSSTDATAMAINGKGYLGLGSNVHSPSFAALKDWWQYDPVADQWTRKANFPGGARWFAAGFVVDGKGYVCSGDRKVNNNITYPNDLWQYDPVNDSWIQKANMPGPGLEAIGLNGTVGGVDCGFVVVGGPGGCLEYNPAKDIWGQLPDMPGGPRHRFAAFVINHSLCVGGGFGGTLGRRMDVHALNWSK